MKKAMPFAVLTAVIAAIVVVAPASAGSPNGQTITITQHVHGSFYEPNATNPCNDDTFNTGQGALFNGNLVNHVTFFTASDEGWGTFTETGSVTATDDGTGVTYSGRATAWGNFNQNERNANTSFTLTLHLTGSDGSTITAHQNTTMVLNANGQETVNFANMSFTCG